MIPAEHVREALLPHYVLDRELGRGGMGAVYLARDVRLERPVAIKVLPPDMAARPDLRERFLNETRTAASFSHPNIVPVHAVEDRGSILYFVMGYIEGETLTSRIARAGSLPPKQVVRILQECAWALSYAHGRGVVHRDVKPDNILIDKGTGRALITDFGISRSQDAPGLTTVGQIIGTPQYMSPEQASGESVDGRSDLYSLGVVAFHALTGQTPFTSGSVHGYLTAHITKPAPPVASVKPDVPAPLAAAVDRLLRKDAAERFQTGEELAEYLDPMRSARPEIAPAIRLFHVQSSPALRNAIVMAILAPIVARRFSGDADQVIVFMALMAVALTLALQSVGRLRDLAAEGFTHADLRTGLAAIETEEAEAHARRRSAPGSRKRQRRRNVIIGAGVLTALVALPLTLMLRIEVAPGIFHVPLHAMVIAVIGASALMATLAYAIAGRSAPSRLSRGMQRLWTGSAGRRLFDSIARSAARERDIGQAVSRESGPLTMLETLPRDVRRELVGVQRVISALMSKQAELSAREAQLAASETEARSGMSAAGSPTFEKLINEISNARAAASREKEEISAALDRIRLEIIRLRSGLGSVAELRAEAEQAGPGGK